MIWQLVEKKTLSLVYFPDRKVIAIASSERKYDLIKNLRVIQIWQTLLLSYNLHAFLAEMQKFNISFTMVILMTSWSWIMNTLILFSVARRSYFRFIRFAIGWATDSRRAWSGYFWSGYWITPSTSRSAFHATYLNSFATGYWALDEQT